MSCELRPIGAIYRCALAFVFIVGVAPSTAFPQSLVCHPIRSGETATQLARRITGDGRNTYQPWFQLMDRSSRFVPKSQYDRIRPGWRACIVKETRKTVVRPAIERETIEARDLPLVSPQVEAAGVPRAIGAADLLWVWLGVALILPLFGWGIVDDYVARRNAVLVVMKHFGHRFVSEFERPLIQQRAERPLRSRLRLRPARARVEILLAPGAGRRYPNLSDHKKNVEYDVVRVVRLLADDSFVRDPLYVQSGWVVVPFRFQMRQNHAGVPCKSSF